MLNNFGSFFDDFNLLVMFSVLVNPGLILIFSKSLLISEGVLWVLIATVGYSKFYLYSKFVHCVFSQFGI